MDDIDALSGVRQVVVVVVVLVVVGRTSVTDDNDNYVLLSPLKAKFTFQKEWMRAQC